eukprot:augustus_masked-scaffold_5-processed-gene-20.21-mRNA-1 protein AED:1.00 eAED:1.00 QI:0/0/0/0/1/1/5/0/969
MNQENEDRAGEDLWELDSRGNPRRRQEPAGERDVSGEGNAAKPTEEEVDDILAQQLNRSEQNLPRANEEIVRLRNTLGNLAIPSTEPSPSAPVPRDAALGNNPLAQRAVPMTPSDTSPATRTNNQAAVTRNVVATETPRGSGSPRPRAERSPEYVTHSSAHQTRREPRKNPGSSGPLPASTDIEIKQDNDTRSRLLDSGFNNLSTKDLLINLVNELRSRTRSPYPPNPPNPPQTPPPASSINTSGFRPPKIDKLKETKREEISEFLLQINQLRHRAAQANVQVSVMEWMSNQVLERLEAQGININSDQYIINYLQRYKQILDQRFGKIYIRSQKFSWCVSDIVLVCTEANAEDLGPTTPELLSYDLGRLKGGEPRCKNVRRLFPKHGKIRSDPEPPSSPAEKTQGRKNENPNVKSQERQQQGSGEEAKRPVQAKEEQKEEDNKAVGKVTFQEMPQKEMKQEETSTLLVPESTMPKVQRSALNMKGYTMKVFNLEGDYWEAVTGCLDSGASFTIGSLNVHSYLCTGIHKIPPMEFMLADDNTSTQTEHQGVIELRVIVDDGPPVIIEQQVEKFNEKCKKLGLQRSGPIIFHNLDEGDDHEQLENVVGGDVNVFEEIDPEKLEEDETFIGEKDKILQEIKRKVESIRIRDVFTVSFVRRLEEILVKNWNTFALPESFLNLSHLPSIHCKLQKDALESITVKARAVGYQQEMWLRKKVDSMLKTNLIVQATPDNTHFAARIFIVPKKGPAKYRMAVNLRPLNKWPIASAERLPVLEHQSGRTTGARIFGTLDIKSGYDQVAVEPESRKYFGLMTQWDTVYHQCSMPQGWANSPMLFHQSIVEHLCKRTRFYMSTFSGMVQWIDDTCIFAKNEEYYMLVLDKFLYRLKEMKVRMSLRKCIFAAKEVEYCGKWITDKGWSFLEEYYAKIFRTSKPQFHHQMAEVLYLATWLSPTIPGLVEYRQKLGGKVNMGAA